MTVAQDITRHYGGDWHGSYGTFATPGHSKADRGMQVTDGEDGGAIFRSFNGGDWRDVKDECRRLGLLPERKRETSAERETGRYEYVGADGVVGYRTRRLERDGARKRFVAEQPDGRGGWQSGIKGLPRLLYRLPDILAADPDAVIYLAEGERKADRLAALGLVGTAVAFGAKGWRDEYATALAGRTVAILPDNDAEGAAFAARARDSIISAGGRAYIVELPGLPAKGDIMDWTGTAEQLRALVDGTISPPVAMLQSCDLLAWANTATPERQWTLLDWVPDRQATLFTGKGSAGKSLLSQILCTCIAASLPFLGITAATGPAIYITAEDGGDEMHIRQKAICAALGVRVADLAGKLHLISLFGELGNELATFDPSGRMSTTARYAQLVATAKTIGPRLIVIDNSAHVFGGNENDRHQVAAFVGLLNRLAVEIGCAVILVAHPNKMGDSYSGSTSWENQVRSRIFMEIPESDEGVIDPDARVIRREKSNYARNGEEIAFIWHRGTFTLPTDLPPNMMAEQAANVQANAENARFMECLTKAIEERRSTSASKSAPNYAPRLFASMPSANRMPVKGFEQAMGRLLHLGKIKADQPLWQRANRAWITGLGPARDVALNPALNVCTERTEPPSQVIDNACTGVHVHDTHISKDILGAPPGAAAPISVKKNGQRQHMPPPVFTATADDDDDDPIEHFR